MSVHDGILRAKVDRKEILIAGCIMDSRSPAIVEVYKLAGYDFLMIDREHTALNDETIADHVRTARCLGIPCMVRVAEDCYHELNRTLDQAPDGIFVPRIRSREQVEKLITNIKYKPEGRRGIAGGSCPVGKYSGWESLADQIEAVNRNMIIGIQIETSEALDDLDGIFSVPGVDMAVVGNDDLSMSIGMPGETDKPEYIAIVERIINACNKYGVLPGTAVKDAQAGSFWIKKGMKVIWHASDIYLLYTICEREVSRMKEGLG